MGDGGGHRRNVRSAEDINKTKTSEDDSLTATVVAGGAVTRILNEDKFGEMETAERNFGFVEVTNEGEKLAGDAPDCGFSEFFTSVDDVLERASTLDVLVFEENIIGTKIEFSSCDDRVQLSEVGMTELAKLFTDSTATFRGDGRAGNDTTNANKRTTETIAASVNLSLVSRKESAVTRFLFHQSKSRVVSKLGRSSCRLVKGSTDSI